MAVQLLADITREHAKDRPDRRAMRYDEDGREWTYAELDADANRVANALLGDGVEPHGRIAYLDKNAPEYFLYLFGGAKINAVSVAVNWRLAAREMEYILNNSEAGVLVIGDEFLGHLAQMDLPAVTRVVVLGDPGDTGYITFDQWIAGQPDDDPALPAAPGDTCYQLYTSGTTGLPKGVELSHANFVHCVDQALAPVGIRSESVSLVCMPLFHIAGSGFGVLGMYWGADMVLLRDVDLAAIVRVVPEQRVTHAMFVPAVLQFLLAQPGVRDADLSSFETILYGASPITEAVLVEAMDVFGCDFIQGYGLTETTGGVSLLAAEDHDPGGPRAHLLRSCGKVIVNHEVRIVDPESRREMPDGEVGEIWVRGPQVMKGYWKNPEASAESLVEDGWFRTGDAGYLLDGYVFIHDRVKDMIISGGENIYPAEIENVLMAHEGIADAAVIGVPSERWGETVKALVTRSDADLTEQQIIEYCRSQLAGYKCPTSVDWIDEIPRNPSGKILKVELRKPYWEDRERFVS